MMKPSWKQQPGKDPRAEECHDPVSEHGELAGGHFPGCWLRLTQLRSISTGGLWLGRGAPSGGQPVVLPPRAAREMTA
jgi:hypothetical protein